MTFNMFIDIPSGDYTAFPMMYTIRYTLKMIQLYFVSSVCHLDYIP